MKLILISFLVLFLFYTSTSGGDSSNNNDSLNDETWTGFKNKNNKKYGSAAEESKRKKIWENNLNKINSYNLKFVTKKNGIKLKMNRFGDLTDEEYIKFYNGYNSTITTIIDSISSIFQSSASPILPDSVDWRTKGYVTPVKNQARCASCWAFSALGSLEGQYYKQTGRLISLSEQNLIDCSSDFGNSGCDSGFIEKAFRYIKKNKGINSQDSYPYKGVNQNCTYDPNNVAATLNRYVTIKSGDEKALTEAIATIGPIAVTIDATLVSFRFYSTGVYSDPDCSSTYLTHGAVAVGYGTTSDGQKYYIVKNSYSEAWGDKGNLLFN